MRFAHVARTFAAGLVVYVAMAACAAESKRLAASDAGPATSDGSSAGGTSGALVDALANPVTDAKAAPESVTEKCDKKTAAGVPFAEHIYPNATEAELAHVVALVEAGGLDGYSRVAQSVYVRAGYVAAACTAGTTVAFVRD